MNIPVSRQIIIYLTYILAGLTASLLPEDAGNKVYSLLGFRLYIPLLIPFIATVVLLYKNKLKLSYSNTRELLIGCIPSLVFLLSLAAIVLSGNAVINLNVNLRYEAGATALTDLPLYLLWNAPLLLLLLIPLNALSSLWLRVTALLLFGIAATLPDITDAGFVLNAGALPETLPLIIAVAAAAGTMTSLTARITTVYLLIFFPVLAFGSSHPAVLSAVMGINTKEWAGFVAALPKSEFPFAVITLSVQCLSAFLFFAIRKKTL